MRVKKSEPGPLVCDKSQTSYFHFGLHTSTARRSHRTAACTPAFILSCQTPHTNRFCQTSAICKQLARESIQNYHQNSQHALVRRRCCCWLSDFAENAARGAAAALSSETKAPTKSVCMQKSFDRRHCLICGLLYKIRHAIRKKTASCVQMQIAFACFEKQSLFCF